MRKEEQSKIYKTMDGTQWARMALNNEFAYDDFTDVKHIDMRKYSLFAAFRHKKKRCYIYNNDDQWYVTRRQNGKCNNVRTYDLSRQTECERFFYDIVIDLRSYAIDGRVLFDSYSLFDLIMYFKKNYRIGD